MSGGRFITRAVHVQKTCHRGNCNVECSIVDAKANPACDHRHSELQTCHDTGLLVITVTNAVSGEFSSRARRIALVIAGGFARGFTVAIRGGQPHPAEQRDSECCSDRNRTSQASRHSVANTQRCGHHTGD